jgi:F0F1-type ATP synthase assembly protein I
MNAMGWLVAKYLVTAAVVVLVSETARRSDRLGGLIGALPLVTFLALVWLYVEKQPPEKIANHAWYTFWYVLPTLPMFLVFPWLLPRLGFWLTMVSSMAIALASFALFARVVRGFGIELLP